MTSTRSTKANDQTRGFSDRDLVDVGDFPEMTEEQIAAARPFKEVFPQLADSIRRMRGQQKAPTKQQVSLRIDRDVVEHFKSRGPGWQVRMGAALRKAAGLWSVGSSRLTLTPRFASARPSDGSYL